MALLAFVVIGATRQNQQQQTTLHIQQRDGETRYEMLARNAALFGVERAVQALSRTFSQGTYPGSLNGAGYRVTVTTSGNVATIHSKGQIADASGTVIKYTVVQKVRRELTLPTTPAPFMEYAFAFEEDVTLHGSFNVDTFRVRGNPLARNANVHTNGRIRTTGHSGVIRGFGSYVTTQDVKWPTSTFRPTYNPTSTPVLRQTSAVDIPNTYDVTEAATNLGMDRSTGTTTLSGTYDFAAMGATRDDPYVWYVNGSLSTSGNVSLKGYVVFLVTGNIVLDDDISTSLPGSTASESTAAWYAGNDITLKGNNDIYGQFFARNDMTVQGPPDIYGNIAVGGEAALHGSTELYYIPASPALTTIWNPAQQTLRRISYSEGW